MESRTARKLGLKKIGEVAEMFGTTPRTLLYYEEEGIIAPRRTGKGTRIYAASDIKRFGIAHRMASLGIPLRTIKELALARLSAETGDSSSRQLCAIIDRLKEELARRLRLIDGLRQDLDRAQLMLRQCRGCQNRPSRATCPGCPSEICIDEVQTLWLTWDMDRGEAGAILAKLGREETGAPDQAAAPAPDQARQPVGDSAAEPAEPPSHVLFRPAT